MKINCIVVDDEPLSQDILSDYVSECPELNLIGIYSTAIEAREAIANNQVDLLILDINMPRLSGIGLMKSLSNPPLVIFVTAYPEYAVEGFDLEAVDYLLKPVSYERFLKAINRVTEKMRKKEHEPNTGKYLMVKADKKMFRLDTDEICFIEAQGDYIKIHTTSKKLMVYDSLSGFLEKLPSGFMKIHKSYAISLSRIDYIEGNQLRILNQVLPISLKYREELMFKLGK